MKWKKNYGFRQLKVLDNSNNNSTDKESTSVVRELNR